MKISHAFRGEEWLPSAPVHILLWKYLFGLNAMPQWAHLPLILKPDGNGKLSKRDGDRLGFPVFPIEWPDKNEVFSGYREKGYFPDAFVNMLALLGWHVSGILRVWAGDPDTAIRHLETALRLSPRARVGNTFLPLGLAHFLSRRFDEAVSKLLLAIQDNPTFTQPYRILAACYAHMGRLDDARRVC